jgi:hypothetical protein
MKVVSGQWLIIYEETFYKTHKVDIFMQAEAKWIVIIWPRGIYMATELLYE